MTWGFLPGFSWPTSPVEQTYVGGCQGPSLGTPIAVYDQLEEGGIGVKGKPVADGVPGELVATAAFPNMPVKFWGDEDGSKYFYAYFAKFDGKTLFHYFLRD